MKKKINFKVEEVIETYSHMCFYAFIEIDDKIINFERVDLQNNDLSKYLESVEELKRKYNRMYQTLLNYREEYKLELMRISLRYETTHCVDNLPI